MIAINYINISQIGYVMEINNELIKRVAEVARLKLSEEEIKKFVPQLKEILDYFAVLQDADVNHLEPSFQPIKIKNRLRDDKVGKCLAQKESLSNSRFNQQGYFKGPRAV
jgi:aspartyl-tRNA(Asn)/glutamyl-tRNA(Gln) amidotransferase subunit C